MIAEVSLKMLFLDFTPSVISDPSAAQESMAVWLVVIIVLLQEWNFLPVFVLSIICFCFFNFFLFWEKGGGGEALFWITHPLDASLIMEYFVKLPLWLVVMVGIVAVEFVTAYSLSGICLFISYFGRKVGGALAELTLSPPPWIHY